MDKKRLIIIGAGETAHLAYEYFTFDSDYKVIAFSVEQQYQVEDRVNGLPVIPLENLPGSFSPASHTAFVAVSSTKLNRVRKRIYQDVKNMGYMLASYVSSRAFVWRNVRIGDNCFILEDNTLQPFVEIGNNVTLWSGNHIGHRSKISDNCFITSHVVVSGFCVVKENCFIGVNSTISDSVTIEKDCVLSLGSVITKNTEANGIYKGNPAQKHKIDSKTFFSLTD
jgi:sugar O-acyltransferase (sialic acid O-acetyltransferase NeuD family)